MKNARLFPVLIILLTGTFLFVSCEKQETKILPTEETLSSDFKAAGGYALYFDGTCDDEDGCDLVVVPDHTSLDLTNAFSIAAWINIEEYVEWATFVTKGGWTQDNEGNWYSVNNYAVHQSGPFTNDYGYLRFSGDNPEYPYPSFLESETQIPLNEWHFVAVTWDGMYMKFYLDGDLDGVHELGGTFTPNDQPLFIGVDLPGGVEWWKGMIDEVRIWNEALKQTHIQAAMTGHAAPLARALVGYWSFNEGEGNVAHDRSPYNNHGEIIGATWVSPGAPMN